MLCFLGHTLTVALNCSRSPLVLYRLLIRLMLRTEAHCNQFCRQLEHTSLADWADLDDECHTVVYGSAIRQMSLADFVQAVHALYSPQSGVDTRQNADQWLIAFKQSSGAWNISRQALAGHSLEVSLQAAQILAWKAKKQLSQLSLQQQSQLVELLTSLLSGQEQFVAPIRRALCVALANLAIQCTDWSRPLETLEVRLPQPAMLEFVTILPQECEDAADAAQSGGAEEAFILKQRVREWCLDVLAWLHGIHSSALASQGNDQLQQPVSMEGMMLQGGMVEATAPLVQCFSAWVKWGCLHYMDPTHAAHFTRAAGALLAAPAPLMAVGVDGVCEVIEHATESLAPLLVDLLLCLPARVEQGVASGEGGGELSHVYSLFCSTHQGVCTGDTQHGHALRQGLLHVLSLPRPSGPLDEQGIEAWRDALLPAVDAAYDIADQMLRPDREEGWEDEDVHDRAFSLPRPISRAARRAFCEAMLLALLQRLQPFPSAFSQPLVSGLGPEVLQAGTWHSPDGVPQALRDQAELVLGVIGDMLGADALMRRLHSAVEATAAREGSGSVPTAMALDVCLYCLRCSAGVYGCHHHKPGQPPPAWLPYMLQLYRMAAEVASGPHSAAQLSLTGAPVTILDFDLLSSVSALAPALIPLLGGEDRSASAGFTDLVVSRAVHAVSAPSRTADVARGSTTDAVDAAADALRAVCSFATSAGFETSEGMVTALEQMLHLLQHPSRVHAYQGAHQQVVVALVHAAEGISPHNPPLLQRCTACMQSCVFAQLTAALQQAQQEAGAAQHAAGTPPAAPPHPHPAAPLSLGGSLWQLQWALKQTQALLNALELYSLYDEDPPQHELLSGQQQGEGGAADAGAALSAALARGAVESFMPCWQPIVRVCRRPLPAEAYQELSLCLSSCMSLAPDSFQPALTSVAELATSCFFIPGGWHLGQALCRAVEVYGGQPQHQQPLLGMAGALLSSPQGLALGELRGGDADPDAAQGLLSLLGCTLRQVPSWGCPFPLPSHPAPSITPVLPLALRLAVANAACNHRGVSQRAVALLSSLALLATEYGSAAGGEARGFMRSGGSGVVQGMVIALLSLNSGTHLPKVVSLMGDVALMAAACAGTPADAQVGPPDYAAVHAAASQLLSTWLQEARVGLTASGILSDEAAQSLLRRLEWQGVLMQATVQAMQRRQDAVEGRQGVIGSPGGVEVRRAMQRSLRQMADAVRQAGLCV